MLKLRKNWKRIKHSFIEFYLAEVFEKVRQFII